VAFMQYSGYFLPACVRFRTHGTTRRFTPPATFLQTLRTRWGGAALPQNSVRWRILYRRAANTLHLRLCSCTVVCIDARQHIPQHTPPLWFALRLRCAHACALTLSPPHTAHLPFAHRLPPRYSTCAYAHAHHPPQLPLLCHHAPSFHHYSMLPHAPAIALAHHRAAPLARRQPGTLLASPFPLPDAKIPAAKNHRIMPALPHCTGYTTALILRACAAIPLPSVCYLAHSALARAGCSAAGRLSCFR